MNKQFRLVVFDWDGTLLDSEGRIVECLHAASQEAGLASLPPKTLSNVIGLGLKEAVETLYPAIDAAVYHHFLERYRHHYLFASQTPTPLFTGAREMLEDLYQRGFWLAIATGKARRGLDRVLAEQDLAHLFHATRCADETFSKPHPQMLLDIMDRVGAEPDQTLMVGDTEYDILMAHHAKTAAVGVGYGVHGRERLLRHPILACVDSLGELAAWLGECEVA